MIGKYHSIETFGAVDGPGLRFILFLQGCNLRCLYCHNPDTWDSKCGKEITVDQVVAEYLKYQKYYKNGGITVSGGEPLLQIDFLIELFKELKKHDVHTCLDTSGSTFIYSSKFDELMEVTDLVLLDIKHIDETKNKELVGMTNEKTINFARYLNKINKPIWIRHVLVEGYTVDETYLQDLGAFISTLDNVQTVELLPYHSMGVIKYKELGKKYIFEKMADLDYKQIEFSVKILNESITKEIPIKVSGMQNK